MNAKQIEAIIENDVPYVDELVWTIDCLDCGDEVTLIYECGEDDIARITFLQCYTVEYHHADNFDKMRAVKDMERCHSPYYLQDISITNENIGGRSGFLALINCSMLDLKVRFQDIKIERRKGSTDTGRYGDGSSVWPEEG